LTANLLYMTHVFHATCAHRFKESEMSILRHDDEVQETAVEATAC